MSEQDTVSPDRSAGERERLAKEILALVTAGPDGDPSRFDPLALEVFAYQYENNRCYREFCDAKGAAPDRVDTWRDIPAFPTHAFKTDVVTSFPLEQAVMANLTSGTTSPNQRGRILRDELGRELAFAANRMMTGAYLFPDFESGRRCRLLILAPSPEMAPSMGMAVGMEQTRVHFGTEDSRFLLGLTGIDVKALVAALRQAESSGTPVALIGSTSAFIYFFKACTRRKLRFQLPPGSRVGDGGGYRGRFGDVVREDYYAMAGDILGVPANHCVNILGMAESATNYFDNSLREAVAGHTEGPRRKVPPPWTRVVAASPEDLSPLPPGEIGLLRHFDLTNLPTVLAVQADNLGFTDEAGGFEIIGRAKMVDGKVSSLPSERAVGPMGDARVFRLLEAYVNFSIDFKMGRLTAADHAPPRTEAESGGPEAVPSCPVVVDDMVAGADDQESAKRAAEALRKFHGADPSLAVPDERGGRNKAGRKPSSPTSPGSTEESQ